MKYLSNAFPIQNDLKHGGALLQLLCSCAVEHAVTRYKKTNNAWNWMGHIDNLLGENINNIKKTSLEGCTLWSTLIFQRSFSCHIMHVHCCTTVWSRHWGHCIGVPWKKLVPWKWLRHVSGKTHPTVGRCSWGLDDLSWDDRSPVVFETAKTESSEQCHWGQSAKVRESGGNRGLQRQV
jgi:hypothetical protein